MLAVLVSVYIEILDVLLLCRSVDVGAIGCTLFNCCLSVLRVRQCTNLDLGVCVLTADVVAEDVSNIFIFVTINRGCNLHFC